MKIKGLSILAALIIIIGVWYLYKISYTYALTHTILITHCSNEINPDVQQHIQKWCSHHCSLRNTQQWIKEFKEAFPIIDRIQSKKETHNALIVSIDNKKLKVQVNNDQVASHDGTLFPISFINQEELTLPHIITNHHIEQNELFKIFIQNLPLYILENYSIDWRAPHEIYLKPKQGATIITRYNLIPSAQNLKHATQLCLDRPTKKGMSCIIDMRFNDQIVIFDTRGR